MNLSSDLHSLNGQSEPNWRDDANGRSILNIVIGKSMLKGTWEDWGIGFVPGYLITHYFAVAKDIVPMALLLYSFHPSNPRSCAIF